MKCEYKRKMLEKHRGDWCLFAAIDPRTGQEISVLCGCGYRQGPDVDYRRRIVRRTLKNELRDLVNGTS